MRPLDGSELDLDWSVFKQYVMEGEWNDVVSFYKANRKYHKKKISESRGTALHVAVNYGDDSVVQRLVDAIIMHEDQEHDESVQDENGKHDDESALKQKDENGNTPLHIAAYRGFTSMCRCMIGEGGERKDLIQDKNEKGETPLFCAVLAGYKDTFAYLQSLALKDFIILFDKNGDTILHCAIKREFFDLAILILHCYPLLFNQVNTDKVTPLEVLATRTSAFKSARNLSWWDQILCYCTPVSYLDPARELKSYLKKVESTQAKEKDETRILIHLSFTALYGRRRRRRRIRREVAPTTVSENEGKPKCYTFLPIVYSIILSFTAFCFDLCLGWIGRRIRREVDSIKNMKQKLVWGGQLLDIIMIDSYQSYMGYDGQKSYDEDEEEVDYAFREVLALDPERMKTTAVSMPSSHEGTANKEGEEKVTQLMAVAKAGIWEINDMNDLKTKLPNASNEINSAKEGFLLVPVAMKNGHETESGKKVDKKETAYLAAAKNGIVEIVDEITYEIPSAVHDTTSKTENVLFVAVRNRQPLVVKTLKKNLDPKLFQSLSLATDNMENTLLHLAASTTGSNHETNWQIAGAAMQMMWDMKWYQYIMELVPEHFVFRSNKDDKTPGEIFREEHKDLLKDSSEWMKDTSNSCSVVAALIATVSFATSTTVPGGTENGKPALEKEPAFDTFAIASLVGLFFSITALVMFLSILTSRKQAQDFRRNLPLKLLLGLSSLFVSITSMLISFCAGHFFVLKDKYHHILFPIYVATCLPATFYAVVQFPLYADLVRAIVTKVPQSSGRGFHL